MIVAAHRARRDWLEACLRSIDAQRIGPGWAVDVRIGVDGCEATSALLLGMGRGHWWSAENVGPYLIRNSLIALDGFGSLPTCRGPGGAVATDERGASGGDSDSPKALLGAPVSPSAAVPPPLPPTHYATFDIDDVMLPGYLARLVELAGPRGIGGSGRWRVDARGRRTSRTPRPYGEGVAVFSRAALEKLGGFRPWRIAADADAVRRAQALGVRVRSTREALCERRVHGRALTQGPREARRSAASAIRAGLAAGELVVALETVALEWRGP